MAAIRELYLTSLLVLFSQISGQRSGNATIEQCGPSNLNIVFNFSLGGENFYDRSWYLNSTANKIAAANSTGFLTVEPPYSSRVTLSGTNGITLSHVSSSDSGSYLFIIITDTSFTFLTATTTVIINDTPDNYCIPVTVNNINSITCKIPAACPAKNSIQARWNDNSTAVLTCPSTTAKYNCCAVGDPVTKCYNGSLCTEAECKGTTTTTTTVNSSSTSMSSATSKVTNDNTSTNPTTTGSSASAASSTSSNVTIGNISVNPTTNGSAARATNSTSTSMSPTTVSPANNTNNTSTSTNPTISGSTTTNKTTSKGSNSIISDIDIKVIVPAVVVPCGLLIIGVIILLVVLCVRRRAGKNVHENPDGMAVQDKGSNIDEWQQSLGHGKATENLDAVYTTPDGFVIYPGPAAMSAARSCKDKKYHGVTDQYSRPYPGTYHNQSAYIPSTYTSARAYTHKDKKHHGVTDQYSRPTIGTYGYQTAYIPSTYMSARTFAQKGKSYDYEGPIRQPTSHLMATSRPAYDQNTYYPQTGYYGHSGEDVYYSGGGQYSYGHRSRSHHDHNGRKQQREYYNQYEMEDYGGNRAGYRHTKQDMAFCY